MIQILSIPEQSVVNIVIAEEIDLQFLCTEVAQKTASFSVNFNSVTKTDSHFYLKGK